GDVDKWDLHMLHYQAWERGVKSLYYLRSKSVQRAAYAGADGVEAAAPVEGMSTPRTDYEECLACQ
ncbi:MAG: ribonucleotide-diphosphate reductase subunit alpha, partial [Caulobacter sp.]